MSARTGYALVGIGTVVTFGSLLQTFIVMGALDLVLLWGAAAIGGIFLIAFGTKLVWTAREEERGVDPEQAPGKTDR